MSAGADIYITTDRDLSTAIGDKADLVGGKLEVTQLPSVADDVLDYAGCGSFPEIGESGKIYVDTTENKLYRYNGSGYVSVGGGSVVFPVTSVNSKTGSVVLNGSDISVTSGEYSGSSVNTAVNGLASGKADKISSSGSTVGHFVSIGENGTLLDSTKDAKDFAPYSHTHEISGVVGLAASLAEKADNAAVTLTSVLNGYKLGAQSDKPLAPAGDYALKSDIPTVPIMSVKRNGTELPIQSGVVDILVPTGTAAVKNVPASGDAGEDEVVLGSDSRLSDSRSPTAHSHGSVTCGNTTLSVTSSGASVTKMAGYQPPVISGYLSIVVSGESYELKSTSFKGPYGPFSMGYIYYVPVNYEIPTNDSEATSGWSFCTYSNGTGAQLMFQQTAHAYVSNFDSANPTLGEWEYVDSSSGEITITREPTTVTENVVLSDDGIIYVGSGQSIDVAGTLLFPHSGSSGMGVTGDVYLSHASVTVGSSSGANVTILSGTTVTPYNYTLKIPDGMSQPASSGSTLMFTGVLPITSGGSTYYVPAFIEQTTGS